MELIERGTPHPRNDFRPAEVTEAELQAAFRPIKSFLTRHEHQLQGKVLEFPS